jgi:transposase
VATEACASAHYWGRQLEALGFEVKLVSSRYVKAYVRGNKNDYNGALAIVEASERAQMRFVALKSTAQQDIQALPGFGPIVVSVFHSEIGSGEAFRRGRDVAAASVWCHASTVAGGKETLLGISKRGDRYLRSRKPKRKPRKAKGPKSQRKAKGSEAKSQRVTKAKGKAKQSQGLES